MYTMLTNKLVDSLKKCYIFVYCQQENVYENDILFIIYVYTEREA